MRVASAVIGGLGALSGVLKGLGFILVSLVLWASERYEFNSFLVLAISANGAVAIFCLLGAVGASFAIFFLDRLRSGVLLMLIGAAGVAVAAAVYGLLWPLTQPPDVQALEGSLFATYSFYLVWLFPVPFLLVGALLAFYARRRAAV